MNEFWKTVLSSVGFSVGACAILGWLCREWISTRIKESIKHEYDKMLEDHKEQVQKRINEHQIEFKNLYEEKIKVIKTLYNDFTELSRSLQVLLSCEKKDDGSNTAMKEKTKAIQSLTSITQKSFNDWLGHCLYLGDEDNTAIMKFFKVIDDFSELYDPSINNFPDTRAEQGKSIFTKVINHLNVLRVQFRKTLNIQDEINNNSSKSEVK